MKDYSLVLAVYNGSETLQLCLDAVLNIDYPKEHFEFTAVNDGSTDDTQKILDSYKPKFKSKGIRFKLIELKKNMGRIHARLTGVENSSYDMLVFLDHRGAAHPDLLRKLDELNYEPVVGNLAQDPGNNLITRFFYAVRRFVYRPYFGMDKFETFITEENFDAIPKGFSPFLCDKERLLRSIPKDKGKNVNDDTKIFKNIIREKKIMKSSEPKITYYERTDPAEAIWHIFHRGPRFVDFYFKPNSKYFLPIIAICLAPFVILAFLFVFKLNGLLLLALSGTLAVTVLAIILSKNIRDFISVIVIGPIIACSFTAGVYKGIFLKTAKGTKKELKS